MKTFCKRHERFYEADGACPYCCVDIVVPPLRPQDDPNLLHAGNCDLRMEVVNARCTCMSDTPSLNAPIQSPCDPRATDEDRRKDHEYLSPPMPPDHDRTKCVICRRAAKEGFSLPADFNPMPAPSSIAPRLTLPSLKWPTVIHPKYRETVRLLEDYFNKLLKELESSFNERFAEMLYAQTEFGPNIRWDGDLKKKLELPGMSEEVFVVSFRTWTSLELALGSRVEYVDRAPGLLRAATRGIRVHGKDGRVRLVFPDRNAPLESGDMIVELEKSLRMYR
jgi:hypothetical protein